MDTPGEELESSPLAPNNKTMSNCLREAEVASPSADPAMTAGQADSLNAALWELPVSHAQSLPSYRD